jgi:hypothetical protein
MSCKSKIVVTTLLRSVWCAALLLLIVVSTVEASWFSRRTTAIITALSPSSLSSITLLKSGGEENSLGWIPRGGSTGKVLRDDAHFSRFSLHSNEVLVAVAHIPLMIEYSS